LQNDPFSIYKESNQKIEFMINTVIN